MGEFIAAAFAFPAVLFTFALLVVVGYWIVVLLGSVEVDALDADTGVGDGIGAGGFTGFLTGLGLGGVPVTVALSLLIVLAWFMSLAGSVLLDRSGLPGPVAGALGSLVLAGALVCAWLGTRLLVLPLRRLLRPSAEPSRRDFVGRACVIRTGRVGPDFGQAEVTADDGSSALVQVRQSADDARGAGRALTAGSTALIFDYSADGEFFLVMPYDLGLGSVPERKAL
jgi:hypothetical protein